MASTIHEAIKIYEAQGDRVDRTEGLRDGYKWLEVVDGEYDVVNVKEGKACDHRFEWVMNGKFLICVHCFVDGT